jgi:hypothetical protein
MYIPAEDVVVPYGASNLETAERVTHVMRKTPNELKKFQQSKGFYRDRSRWLTPSTLGRGREGHC